ncbi:diguanylate cyclase domain-containing protein [Magnetospirillum sulfuroxidans]|uniref:Diguanylate cyclase n=1 Tax=Magnetospirillum sulfuroxidans TaxID=611300 RepID=A0ABS5I872_9PROT|nr:diguanylate cyclase [Magnetospirillum sulfuroxidans]MBR9970605.1 diguanylate cyclase [Magnetospirillum sulfuroxidans]
MIRLANVLIIDANTARSATLKERLARGGYHAGTADSVAKGLENAHIEHPDLILIGTPDQGDAVTLGSQIKHDLEIADIPVVLIADRLLAELCGQCLDAGLDDVLSISCDDAELFARMRPLVRLATMHTELRQRAITARSFGVQARDRMVNSADTPATILIIGDDPEPVGAVLAGYGEVVLATSLYEAEDLLVRRNFDAAVLSFAQEPEGLLSFCSQVRNNPRLFNLPMVLLAGLGTDNADSYRRGATRVLGRPVEPLVLKSAVLSLVRRQQLRWSIRGALNDSLAPSTREAVTGAYSRAFLEAYLGSRIETAKTQDRHLAVVFFAAPNIEGVRQQFGDDAALHLTQQVGQWITGLLRAEDLTASFKPHEFCVVLPDTPIHEAEVVMHRIAGVLAYTDFAVRDVYQPVKVWVQVGCTVVDGQDSLDSVLSRARQNLD